VAQAAADREAALLGEVEVLLRRAEEAEARGADLERQLSQARQDAGAADVRSLSQALSGETSTASHAELAAATGGFAAASILGRGGFGAVYRGELRGQAVAVKRLDHVRRPPLFPIVPFCLRSARVQRVTRLPPPAAAAGLAAGPAGSAV
jgi:hypothetical protein